MEAAVQWSKIPTLEEKYNSTKLDVKIKQPTVVCVLLITDSIDLGQSNNLEIQLKGNQTNRISLWWAPAQLWKLTCTWSDPPGGRWLAGSRRTWARWPSGSPAGGGGGARWLLRKYFRKYFNLYFAPSHNMSARKNILNFQIFENLIKIHKSLNLNIFSQSVFAYIYQPWILTPFHADSDILRVSTEEGKEVPFSFLETTKKL